MSGRKSVTSHPVHLPETMIQGRISHIQGVWKSWGMVRTCKEVKSLIFHPWGHYFPTLLWNNPVNLGRMLLAIARRASSCCWNRLKRPNCRVWWILKHVCSLAIDHLFQ
jgi:hypothetical protein